MEFFSQLIKKFNIKCQSKTFQKNIVDKFERSDKILSETLFIGLKNISDEIKNYKKHLHIILTGSEILNEEVILFLEKRKDKSTIYTLSSIDQDYFKNIFNIQSKLLFFDFPKTNLEKTKKLIYFYRIVQNNELDNNKDFNSYLSECEKSVFDDVKSIKIIFLEPFFTMTNPYISIAMTKGVNIEKINFFYLSFSDVVNNFKKETNSLLEKYYSYRSNFIKISNFIYLLTHTKKFIENKVKNEELSKKINNIFELTESKDNYFVIISDDYEYLKKIENEIALKIYVSSSDEYIVKKIENNFIIINKYFFDEEQMKNLKRFHNKRGQELENKYSTYKEAKVFQFIIKRENDVIFAKNHINLFNKYNIKTAIRVYAPIPIDFSYNGILTQHKLQEFEIIPDSKIYYSSEYDIEQNLPKLILTDNIEIKKLDKLLILVSSTQYPSYGGAATNAYNIIKYFKKNTNVNTVGVFIDSCEDIADKANPDNLKDVIGLQYKDFNSPDILWRMIEVFGDTPDIAFCKNCMAPKLIKTVFPNCVNVFLVSGIWGFSQLECGANEITDFTPIRRTPEEKSIEMSNLIICNSDLTIDYFKKIYGDIIGTKLLQNPVDTTKYNVFHKTKHHKEKRVIDFIAIASNVNRPVKNLKFIKDVLTFNKKFQKRRIVIIGENTEELFGDLRQTHNIEIISLIKQHEVEAYLRKSRVIVIPSLFDSNSNVFREAVFNGVIPFISCNVAHPKKYPNFLTFDSYDIVEWAYRISFVLENYHEVSQKYSLQKYFSNDDDLLNYVF